MMMNISKEAADLTKEESHDTRAGKTTTSSWSRLKDPRIVRVSRAFGGKDRHSKVCTVKGLRDRRVRLSVPTAIQLYDLQDRLGLNQPSKVVDWLLHAAKNEIDELPPLQFPPFPIMDQKNIGAAAGLTNWNELGKCKDNIVNIVAQQDHQEYCNWGNSSSNSYNDSFARWDPSNLTLSHHHPASSRLMLPHAGDWPPNFNLMAPSGSGSQSQSHHQHQLLVYHQHGMSTSTQSYFPNSQIGEIHEPGKQLDLYTNNNNNETSNTTSPTQPQLHFNMMTANLLPSQNDDAS